MTLVNWLYVVQVYGAYTEIPVRTILSKADRH
jgi:hypothetical protein